MLRTNSKFKTNSGKMITFLAVTTLSAPMGFIYAPHANAQSYYGVQSDGIGGMINDFLKSIMGSMGSGGDDDIALGTVDTSSAEAYLDKEIERIKNQNDGYINSFANIIGKDVLDVDQNKVGEIHDIIVYKSTGKSVNLIVNKDGNAAVRELKAVSFKDILTQSENGETQLTLNSGAFSEDKDFDYADMDFNKYLSLKYLLEGQVLDDKNEVAGKIEAVIYENAEVKNICFLLKPKLINNAENSEESRFSLPFKYSNITKNVDGYDLKLNNKQTVALAENLFTD